MTYESVSSFAEISRKTNYRNSGIIKFHFIKMANDSSTNGLQETRQGSLKPENGEKIRWFILQFTVKGKKRSLNSNFLVCNSYRKSVVLCKQYFGPITGTKFADIVDWSFHFAFENSINPVLKKFLIDGCRRQNVMTALCAAARVGELVFKTSPRSPDLNPIENLFNLLV